MQVEIEGVTCLLHWQYIEEEKYIWEEGEINSKLYLQL